MLYRCRLYNSREKTMKVTDIFKKNDFCQTCIQMSNASQVCPKTAPKSSKKISVKGTPIRQSVGIDVAKKDLKVCFSQEFLGRQIKVIGSRTFLNTTAGFAALLVWINQKSAPSVAFSLTLEATGVYYENLAYFFHQRSYSVHVVLPNVAKLFIKSHNVQSKTDGLDAQMLALLGLERELRLWQPAALSIRQLKGLTRERLAIIEERTALLNRLHALNSAHDAHKETIKRLKKVIALLDKQIEEVEKQIEQSIENDAVLAEKVNNIRKIKGISTTTIAILIAETNGFENFDNRAQLTKFSGYDVVHNQSGETLNGKTYISKKGNRFIRRALYLPAISVVKYEPHFKALYERVYEKTKIKMKGYVAVQRKLLITVYALFKNNCAFISDFGEVQKQAEKINSELVLQENK
jgi:transposase